MATGFRRRRFGRRFSRRRRFVRRFVRKVRRISKATIRRMSEVKWATFNLDGSTSAYNALNITEITPVIGPGTSKTQRIGNRIKYKFLTLDAFCWVEDSSITPSNAGVFACRAVLLTARATNLTTTDLIDSSGFDTTNTWHPFNGTHCRVIKDWKFLLNALHPSSVDIAYPMLVPSAKSLHARKKFNNNVTMRTGVVVTSDPQDRIYLVWGMAASPLTSLNVQMRMSIFNRLSFIDI